MLHEIDMICCFTSQQVNQRLSWIFTTVLFCCVCLFIFVWINKLKKHFYDNILYFSLRLLIYIWECKILLYNILIKVAKTCEKVLRCRMSLTTKVKVAKFSFLNEKSYNKTVIDFNFRRHKDLSTIKSDIHLGELSLFQVDKSLCLPHWSQ